MPRSRKRYKVQMDQEPKENNKPVLSSMYITMHREGTKWSINFYPDYGAEF